MAFAPTLVPRADMGPVPRVEITFTSVHEDTATAIVYRMAAGRTFVVRGGELVAAAGGFALIDTECPFAVDVTYRAEMFTAGGISLGYTDGAVTTLAFAGTVVHQPLDPNRAVLVRPEKSTTSSIDRSAVGELVRPLGRSIPVWIGFGGIGGVENIPLALVTDTAAAEATFLSIFGGPGDMQVPIICLRSSLQLGLPQPLFARVDPTRIGINQRAGGEATRWDMTGVEVAPPAAMVLTAILTYGDLEAAYSTYSEFEGAYLTYLAAESDFSLAGTA